MLERRCLLRKGGGGSACLVGQAVALQGAGPGGPLECLPRIVWAKHRSVWGGPVHWVVPVCIAQFQQSHVTASLLLASTAACSLHLQHCRHRIPSAHGCEQYDARRKEVLPQLERHSVWQVCVSCTACRGPSLTKILSKCLAERRGPGRVWDRTAERHGCAQNVQSCRGCLLRTNVHECECSCSQTHWERGLNDSSDMQSQA